MNIQWSEIRKAQYSFRLKSWISSNSGHFCVKLQELNLVMSVVGFFVRHWNLCTVLKFSPLPSIWIEYIFQWEPKCPLKQILYSLRGVHIERNAVWECQWCEYISLKFSIVWNGSYFYYFPSFRARFYFRFKWRVD